MRLKRLARKLGPMWGKMWRSGGFNDGTRNTGYSCGKCVRCFLNPIWGMLLCFNQHGMSVFALGRQFELSFS